MCVYECACLCHSLLHLDFNIITKVVLGRFFFFWFLWIWTRTIFFPKFRLAQWDHMILDTGKENKDKKTTASDFCSQKRPRKWQETENIIAWTLVNDGPCVVQCMILISLSKGCLEHSTLVQTAFSGSDSIRLYIKLLYNEKHSRRELVTQHAGWK